jgi:hypothetical protein
LLGQRAIIKEEEKGYQHHGILFYLQKEGENTLGIIFMLRDNWLI